MGIARFQEAKSGNFREGADSERKAFRETFGMTLTWGGKPFGRFPGGRPMKDERLKMKIEIWRLMKTARQ